MEESSAQQIVLGAALHGTREKLEALALALGLPAASRQPQPGAHGRHILIETGSEAPQAVHAMAARHQRGTVARKRGS